MHSGCQAVAEPVAQDLEEGVQWGSYLLASGGHSQRNQQPRAWAFLQRDQEPGEKMSLSATTDTVDSAMLCASMSPNTRLPQLPQWPTLMLLSVRRS